MNDAADPSWFAVVLRWWTLRHVERLPKRSFAAIGIMSVLWLALWIGIDWWERGPDPVPTPDGIPMLAWYGAGVMALAAILRGRPRTPAFMSTLALGCGIVPLPLLLMTIAADFLEPHWLWLACMAGGSYAAVYFARGLRTAFGRTQPLLALAGVLFMSGFVYASMVTDAAADLWVARDSSEVSDEDVAEREAALFEQADRIDEALEAVHRDASPQPQAFFLGFAGVGAEKVFAQEIGLASRVIGERFGSSERRLALINDERDLANSPLASVSGLIYALHGLAAHMNLDRDVLFLAISSHGSEDPIIAVENSNFSLSGLDRDDLAAALRDSGIKWRVILISACYAGGFIEPLRDSHTIVITAAAADRASFGCSNDSDLTYFGAAFYRDALPEAATLRQAFEKAKLAIGARERAAGETPSEPQAYFGAEIEPYVDALTLGTARR